MSDSDMHAHYMRALDEIYRLRIALAYEARLVEAGLAYVTLAKGLRQNLQNALERMRGAARGEDSYAAIGPETRQMVLDLARAPRTLTRDQWEASAAQIPPA